MAVCTKQVVQDSDHHCGWFYVAAGQTVVVVENKQMVCFGTLENDGEVHTEGMLIVED